MTRGAKLMFQLILVGAVLTGTAAQAAVQCGDAFNSILSSAQTSALLQAKSGDFEVAAMSGSIGGRQRHVIFLGEYHVKSPQAKSDGLGVVQQFTLRAVEGVDFQATWGGRLLAWTVDAAYRLANAFSLGQRQEGSTIDDVIADRIARETDGRPRAKNLQLEEGHKPSRAENIQSILLPATLVSCAGAVCSLVTEYVAPGHALNTALADVSYGVMLFTGGQFYAAQALGRWYKDSNWYKYVFSLQLSFLNSRNLTMAQNIQKALVDHPDEDALLVIVGREHVPGLRELLHNDGFRDEALLESPSHTQGGTRGNGTEDRIHHRQ